MIHYLPDIQFEMPFYQADKNAKEEEEEEEEHNTPEEEEEEEEVEKEEEEVEEKGEATSWLEDLGLETSQFPNLNPNRAKT